MLVKTAIGYGVVIDLSNYQTERTCGFERTPNTFKLSHIHRKFSVMAAPRRSSLFSGVDASAT